MTEQTVPQLIELTLDYALQAKQHDRAYEATFRSKATPARRFNGSAHYWARVWHDEAADSAWKCIKWAQS